MKLFRLLEHHDRFRPKNGLPQILGDGFLMEHNRIYREIRLEITNSKIALSSDFDPAYLALPLAQLESLLAKKTIPFFDNVTVLREIETRIPHACVWDEVVDNLKRNYVFHESCHAIARLESSKIWPIECVGELKILQMLLEESFANACELLGNAEVSDATHRIFYEVNSYILMFSHRSLLNELTQELGSEELLRFLILCYLHSNFLIDRLEDRTFDRILNLLGSAKNQISPMKKDSKNLKKLRSLSKLTFELNPRFRQVTNRFYLKFVRANLQGANQNLNLREIDFLSILENQPGFRELIDSMLGKVF